MRSVLILFTCYDRPSYYTAQWAAALHQDLVQRKDTVCLSYDAGVFCRNSTGLADTIGRVDYVVFYGHGTQDEWTALPELPGAQPPVPSIPLVETGTVRDLQEKKVYAGCCWSLKGLGQAYVGNFAQGEFIGYDQEFDFDFSNEQHFREVVNQAVIAYVNGDPAQKVAGDLQNEWTILRDRFTKGNLKHRSNAAMAAACADRNRQRVGCLP